jgi:hypothetical protein
MTVGVLGTKVKKLPSLPKELEERISKPAIEHHEEIKRRRSERHDLKKKRKIRNPEQVKAGRWVAGEINTMVQEAGKLTGTDRSGRLSLVDNFRAIMEGSDRNQASQKLQTMRATDGLMMGGGSTSADQKRDDVQRRRQTRKDLKKKTKVRDPAEKERLRLESAEANRDLQLADVKLRNDPTDKMAETKKIAAKHMVSVQSYLPHKQARQQLQGIHQANKEQHERWNAV